MIDCEYDKTGLAAVGPVRKGGSVITCVWRGWAPADCAQQYERHYRSEVLPVLRGVAGFEGARLLRRTTGDETESVSLTFFDDLDTVRAFAGPDPETAVVADDAREVLVRFDDHVGHYETAFETS
jgi:heme-degrading monooxygenase HmoA